MAVDLLTLEQIDLLIDAAMQGLQSVTVDGMTVQVRPLDELLKWRALRVSRDNAANNRSPLRFQRIIPPGTS